MTLPSDIPPEIADRAAILMDANRHVTDDLEYTARILMAVGRGGGDPQRYGLTGQQWDVLVWVETDTAERHGIPPTIREIARRFGFSPSHAHGVVTALVERGFITRLPGRARSIALVQKQNVSTAHKFPGVA